MTSTNKGQRRYWLAGNREAGQDVFFVEALDKSIWKPGTAENWDTCWYTGMPDPGVFEQLDDYKTINHIPGNNGLTIKDYLHETLRATRTRLSNQKNIARMGYFPRVYAMPDDYHELQQCAAQNPNKKWILKPKNSSRGRGIEVVQDIANIPLNNKWMVQEYIDNPHVMNERKYVLRLYVLVTSVEPLRIYLHREGFAKLASEPYNIEDPDNPFAHLTNPDVNATNTDADAPVVFVGLSEYRQWLRDEGHDDEALFAKIRDLVTLTVISVRERMRRRINAQKASARGCYELLGLDCLVDEQLKPWILECNLSPSLEVCAGPEDGGDTETTIKRGMVADMVSLVGINTPPTDHDKISKEERIARDAEAELSRAGDFECLFPARENVEDYLSFFPVPRYADMVSARQVTGGALKPVRLAPNCTTEIISEDELALYFEKNGTLYTPNAISGWIWLKITGGADPEDVAAELIASHEAAHGTPSEDEKWMIHENIWDALSNWAQLGLLHREGETAPDLPSSHKMPQASLSSDTLLLGERVIAVDYGCPAVAARLGEMFAPLRTKEKANLSIAVQRAPVGYAMAIGPQLITTGLGLDNVAQVVSRALFEQAPNGENEIAIAGTLVPLNDKEAVLFVAGRETQWEDALALMFSSLTKKGYGGAVRLDLKQKNSTWEIGLPVRLNEDDVDTVEKALGTTLPSYIQNWTSGGQGRLLGADTNNDAKPCFLRTIIIPERNEANQTALQQASIHRALDALLVSAVGEQGASLTGAQVSALNNWLEECDVRTLSFSNPADAAQKLAKAMEIG